MFKIFKNEYNDKKEKKEKPYDVLDEFKYPVKNDGIKDNYIKNRIEKQIKWYDKKSVKYRNTYRNSMIMTIILNGSIPFLTFFTGIENAGLVFLFKTLIIACGTIAGIVTAIMGLYNYHDIWSKYRINCEMLKSILHRYQTSSDEFSNLNENARFKLLVSKSESYLIEEYKKEVQLFSKQNDLNVNLNGNENTTSLPEETAKQDYASSGIKEN